MQTNEFNNRIDAQRQVLQAVNRHHCVEELLGLSRKAIERWVSVNRIKPTGEVATVLIQISSKLFFLSCKSQEQVTEEYRLLSGEVHSLRMRLEKALVEIS
jgi:hypothetical protein